MSLKALQQIHDKGWSHNDFQLKNIMMNDMCQSSSVRAVDLDGMSRKHGPRGIRMLRDVAMFMGVCDQGAFPLPQMVAEVDRKGQGMANRSIQECGPRARAIELGQGPANNLQRLGQPAHGQ